MNIAKLQGQVLTEPVITDIVEGREYLSFMLDMSDNGKDDECVRVVVSSHIFEFASKIKKGDCIYVKGSFNSEMMGNESGVTKYMYVFAWKIEFLRKAKTRNNWVKISGKICGDLREHYGNLDFTLRVEPENHRPSFIPCIIPNFHDGIMHNITLRPGDTIFLRGFIRSRTYARSRLGKKIAYEFVVENML